MFVEPYNDIGLLRDIAQELGPVRHGKFRPLDRHREPMDKSSKKKKATKMAKASRRRNRR